MADFLRFRTYRLKDLHVKIVKFGKNYKQNSFIKTAVFDVDYQNLITNFKNLVSGFFPEFPDPVFFRKKSLRGFAS